MARRYAATTSFADAVLLILTAVSAVAIGVEFAIQIGSAASIVWYVLHASRLKTQELVVDPERVVRARISSDPPAKNVAIYDIEGELFFGAAPTSWDRGGR
jgi:sulfate permease, SulP family